MSSKLTKKINITGKLTLLTGLHIGGSSDNVEIGGIDNIVIRTARRVKKSNGYGIDNQPYIPGSSIKGKMRCLLEQTKGAAATGNDDDVNALFGITERKADPRENVLAKSNVRSALIVRDAYLDEDSIKLLGESENLSRYTENKYENSIDRVKGTASNPRQTERIPAGASFDVNFIVNVWDDCELNETSLLNLLREGLNALENDYLGGSGSRGYGQIQFSSLKYVELDQSNSWSYDKKKLNEFDRAVK